MKELLSSQPNCGEEAFDIIRSLIPVCNLVIVDSIAAMVPKAEVEGSSGDGGMALHARLMSSETKKIVRAGRQNTNARSIQKSDQAQSGYNVREPRNYNRRECNEVLCINPPRLSKKGGYKDRYLIVGNEVEIRQSKSKCSTPYGKDKFYMYFDGPRTIAANTLEFCVSIGQVEKLEPGIRTITTVSDRGGRTW